MSERKIVECVPNFSEGRDKAKIEAIAQAIRSVVGVSLLDVDPGPDTNRTVYTFVGEPEAVLSAALAAARAAWESIDMARHSGAHPRMGALDVCPFVPVSGLSMEDCVALSKRFGESLARELGVPVYLYEKAASRPERKSLADIRSGEYEALPDKLAKSEWKPDFGPATFVPRWGATVTGAREFLIAYNVNLNTRDKKLANEIALTIREGGRAAKDAAGNVLKDASGATVKLPGLLKEVRAIGWYIDSYRLAQVSINLLDYHATPLHVVFETVKAEAEKLGMLVTGSEIVGLVPLEPLLAAGRHFLSKTGKSEGASSLELVETAIRSMGLASVGTFDPAKKIVEWACNPQRPLVSMRTVDFVDEVSNDSVAPGGGSVAALAGSLGAALAAMVGNLTVGKKGYEAKWSELSALAVKAQSVKERLLDAVDEDTAAFNGILEAGRLPKATEAEKAAREAALEAANKRAAEVPLASAKASLEAAKLCVEAAEKGNVNSVSDAGVGALMARSAVIGAAFNVLINLAGVKDRAFAENLERQANALISEAEAVEAKAIEKVRATIGR
ncbi:MAG TPA: glutamate formimidoyltransferase [Rectinemataceae bacterium]|nr:glutamate formimidoyltransferase [Rectinemataceae bacterium]